MSNCSTVTPLPDPAEAVRQALNSLVAHEPLAKLVGPKSKVTIAFDDPASLVPAQNQPDFREVTIKVLLEEYRHSGLYVTTGVGAFDD